MKRNGHSIEKEPFFFLQQNVFFLIFKESFFPPSFFPISSPFEKESELFVLRNDSGRAGLFICVLGRGLIFFFRRPTPGRVYSEPDGRVFRIRMEGLEVESEGF